MSESERADYATRFQPGHPHAAAGRRRGMARRRGGELADLLPPLDSPENIRRSNEIVRDAAFRAFIPGAAASACIRAAEVALKALEVQLDLHRLRELEAKLHDARGGEGARAARPDRAGVVSEWAERVLAALPPSGERSLFRVSHDAGLPRGVIRRAVAELQRGGRVVVRRLGERGPLLLRRRDAEA